MGKKHEKILATIFANHPSANIHWQEVESMLLHLGAELREGGGTRVIVALAGQELPLHRPHHSATMTKATLHQLKSFLQMAGIKAEH